jgi:ATP/maltotriose-dependent transcriptional regulator MalT
MVSAILATKLFIPTPPKELVSRQRLIEKLNQGIHKKLTLISAPAGFGKTTLASEWARNLQLDRKNEICVCWLSLAENDNDPTRFLKYIIAALEQGCGTDKGSFQGALNILQSPQQPPIENVLLPIINDIATSSEKIVLFLDDYHLIDSQIIHDALKFLIGNMPPQMHLVISTREDPQFHISRLRAGGQLTDLRATDLRFELSEAINFLNQITGLNLTKDDVALLETRTEGWIAGLVLAAISLQGNDDPAGFIASFTGSNRLVLDYLAEEVLEHQSAEIQEFLLITSCLDRLCRSLCDSLTGKTNSQKILESLENANMFIIPLDDERHWYRYHHLFKDLLRSHLQQSHPEKIPAIQGKASHWFNRNGFIDEAIEFALAAGDFDKAVELIESIADVVWIKGELKKLADWLSAIPEEKLYTKPNLCIFHASSLFIVGQQDEARISLQIAEKKIGFQEIAIPDRHDQIMASGENRSMIGRIAATRAMMGFYLGDIPNQLIQNANLALKYLPEEDLPWRSSVAHALADAQIFIGYLPEAYRTRVEAIEISKATGNNFHLMIGNLKLAVVLRYQGQIHQVLDLCEEQMQFCTSSGMSNPAAIGLLFAIWGEALAEINDLSGALSKAIEGLELAEIGGDIASIGWSYICLVRVLCSRGDLAGAEEIIQMMRATSEEHTIPPWIESMLIARQVRIWLAQGDLDRVTRWVDQIQQGPNAKVTCQNELEYLALARHNIAQAQYDEALRILKSLLAIAQSLSRTSREIETLIQLALAYEGLEETDKSLSALEQALSLAEPRGYLRTFVDEGQPMENLLQKALSKEIAPEYIHQLLAAINVDKARLSAKHAEKTNQSGLIEPLSEREIEVLQLIAEGLTNQEIAAHLFLAPSTVKVHTRNIYRKMGVNHRTQAVKKARGLDLLSASF